MLDLPISSAAFSPFLEKLLWRQGKKPHREEVVEGVLFHGRKQIDAYQSTSGVVKRYSDTWTIIVPAQYALVEQFVNGDKLYRQTRENEELTVRSVTKEVGEWVLAVSSGTSLVMSY